MKLIDDPRAEWARLLATPVALKLREDPQGGYVRGIPRPALSLPPARLAKDCVLDRIEFTERSPVLPSYLSFYLSYRGHKDKVHYPLRDSAFAKRLWKHLRQHPQCQHKTLKEIGQLDLAF
jgi:hypothetical protein